MFSDIGDQKVYFYSKNLNVTIKRCCNICVPLPYMEGIVLRCNIDLYHE